MPEDVYHKHLPRLLDAQYADFTEDLPFWLSLAKDTESPVLELGCGPGRILLALAQAGFQVLGLDNHPGMLARARANLPPGLAPRVSLVQADLRRFSLPQVFGLAIVACNTFAALPDAEAASGLESIRSHLIPGGTLAIDLPNPEEALENLPAPDEPLASFLEPESHNPIQLYARHQFGADPKHVTVTWAYHELLPDGQVAPHEWTTTYHLRSPNAMRKLLAEAGFSEPEIYGDYDRGPLRPDSVRMLLVSKTPIPH